MPTLVRASGAEHGVLSTAGGGILDASDGGSVATAAARSGSYGYRSTLSVSTGNTWEWTISGSPTTVVVVGYVRASDFTVASKIRCYELRAGNGVSSFYALIGFNSSGNPFVSSITGSGSDTVDTGTTFTDNQWYRLEMRASISGDTLTIDWGHASADGSLTNGTQHTRTGFTGFTFNDFRWGAFALDTSVTTTVDFDDWGYSTTSGDYPLGAVKVLGYSPNAVGTHSVDAATSVYFFKDVGGTETALGNSGDTTSHQQIDGVPLDGDADHVFVRASTPASTFADPDGAGTATAWTGSVTDIDDAVRQPTAPSDGLTISSSTDEQSETVTFSNPTFVSGATYRLWVYGTGGTKRACDVAFSYNGSDPGTGSATRAELIPASGAAAWRSRDLTAPANQTELDALRVQFICNTTAGGGGATACSVDAAYLEIIPPTTQPTNTHYLEYALADSAESTAPIAVVGIVALRQDTAANCSITAKLRANSNESNIYSGDINSATNIYKSAIFTTAPGGAAWTDTIFDGATLRWGYTADADGTPRLVDAILEAVFAVSSAGTVTVAAAVAGTGTLAADLSVTKALAATPAGIGAVAPAVAITRALEAAISGAGVVSPAVSMTKTLEASVAGQGAVAADLLVPKLLAAAVAGVGSVVADFVRQVALASSPVGTGSVAADFVRRLAIDAAVAGQGAVVAEFVTEAAGDTTVPDTRDIAPFIASDIF